MTASARGDQPARLPCTLQMKTCGAVQYSPAQPQAGGLPRCMGQLPTPHSALGLEGSSEKLPSLEMVLPQFL